MGKIGKINKVLEFCDLEDETYASMCFEAMCSLSRQLYLVTVNEHDDAPVLERNYVLSMVFQLGKNTGKDSNFGINVFPSGENNKQIDLNLQEIGETYKDLYEKDLRHPLEFIPDLVIHTSHDKRAKDSNGQCVILEAKTTNTLSKVAFFKDFFKLNVYLCSLNYENAIYLIVNTEKDKIENLIKLYLKNGLFMSKDKIEKLLFFIQDNKDTTPYVCKLSEAFVQMIKDE